jgi:serine/threonine-protein kinase
MGEPPSIGRYRIVRKLGEGGMGVVYAAHDDRLDRPVAIKVMRAQSADTQDRQRLWREARAAASVNHPNVCQLYEIAEDGSELFLAMELLDGEPLNVRLTAGPLALNDAGQVELGILSALGALHQRGLVHRDLKPSNVFLSKHGVKLLDFGLARPFSDHGAVGSGVTQPGMLVGTPRYMAPEQIEGRALDARSDLFTAGVLLYEMPHSAVRQARWHSTASFIGHSASAPRIGSRAPRRLRRTCGQRCRPSIPATRKRRFAR